MTISRDYIVSGSSTTESRDMHKSAVAVAHCRREAYIRRELLVLKNITRVNSGLHTIQVVPTSSLLYSNWTNSHDQLKSGRLYP